MPIWVGDVWMNAIRISDRGERLLGDIMNWMTDIVYKQYTQIRNQKDQQQMWVYQGWKNLASMPVSIISYRLQSMHHPEACPPRRTPSSATRLLHHFGLLDLKPQEAWIHKEPHISERSPEQWARPPWTRPLHSARIFGLNEVEHRHTINLEWAYCIDYNKQTCES